MNTCTCVTDLSCCALCSLRSCDCSPNDPCRDPKRFKVCPVHSPQSIAEYGSSVTINWAEVMRDDN